MDQYAIYFKNCIYEYQLNIRNENKLEEKIIKCKCKITHISAAIYPRLHSHLLSKLVPKFKSRKSSIIVFFYMQII